MRQLKNSFAKLIERMSEEGAVATAVLAFKFVMDLRGQSCTSTDLLAFTALGSYLTLRLLRSFAFPKE